MKKHGLLLPLAVLGMDMLVLQVLWGSFNGFEGEEEEEEEGAVFWGSAGKGKPIYSTRAMLRFLAVCLALLFG